MHKILYFFLLFLIFIQSEAFLKKRTSAKTKACANPISIINAGNDLPLCLKDIQRDSAGVARYATVALGTTDQTDKWCVLDDERIQHIDSGLYLNVHGLGLVCWARDTCEWAAQVDAYSTKGSAWNWHKIGSETGYNFLSVMERVLTVLSAGELNLRPINKNQLSFTQQWKFEA